MAVDKTSHLVPRLRFLDFEEGSAWSIESLGHLFHERQEIGFTELPLLSVTDRKGVVPQEETNRKNTASSNKSKYLRVVPGDIAYNTMRMWEGRSALVGMEGMVSPAYTVCEPSKETNSKFYSYYFKTESLIKQFRKYSQGLVKDTLSLKYGTFSNIQVGFPSPDEQTRIADCLGSLDELITATGRKLEALRKHKQGLLQQLFPQPGETVPRLRFPEFSNAPHWRTSTFGKRCESFSGGTPDTSNKNFFGGTIPFIRSAEISLNETEIFLTNEGLEYSSAKMVGCGDLLVALYGANSGETALSNIDGAINQAILCLRSNDSTPFLYHYLTAKKNWIIATYLQGGQGNLSGRIILSVPLNIPNRDEQEKIADCLNSLDELIVTENRKLETLQQHKQGLMQQLFPLLNGQ